MVTADGPYAHDGHSFTSPNPLFFDEIYCQVILILNLCFSATAEAFSVFPFVPSMKIAFNSLSTRTPPSQNPFSPFVFYTMCWWLIFQELEFSASLSCGALHRAVFYIRGCCQEKAGVVGNISCLSKVKKRLNPEESIVSHLILDFMVSSPSEKCFWEAQRRNN